MPRYRFKLEGSSSAAASEVFPTDQAAKLHACTVSDELSRNAWCPFRVLVLDQYGTLLAAVSPIQE